MVGRGQVPALSVSGKRYTHPMKPEQQTGASTTFQVAVSEDSARRLEELAGAAGMSPEQFLRTSVEEWLSHPRPGFSDAASYVLSKNAELYRRLA